MHIIFKTILGLIGSLLLSNISAAENYNVTKVAEGIYYHQGVHEDASPDNFGAIGNASFVIGDQCVAIIDSGGSYMEGTYLRQAIKEHTDLPVCYVINTHVHPDHLLGNAAFKDSTPEYIGHEKLPAALAARKPFFVRVFKETLGDAYAGSEFIAPTRTVSLNEPVTLDLGNRELTLTAYTTSHTDHDLSVLDKNTNTFWTGDLLFMGRIPVIDGSINGWINTIEQLQTRQFNYVIPGHGPAGCNQWQQGLKDELRYFRIIRSEIREIIADLGTIDQATETVGLQERAHWELFDQYHRRNITASFVELEWE